MKENQIADLQSRLSDKEKECAAKGENLIKIQAEYSETKH